MIVATLPEPTVLPPSRSSSMFLLTTTNEKPLIIPSKHAGFSLHFTQFLIFMGQNWVTPLFPLGVPKSIAIFFISATNSPYCFIISEKTSDNTTSVAS